MITMLRRNPVLGLIVTAVGIVFSSPAYSADEPAFVGPLRSRFAPMLDPELRTGLDLLVRYAVRCKPSDASLWTSIARAKSFKLLPATYDFRIPIAPHGVYELREPYRLLLIAADTSVFIFGYPATSGASERLFNVSTDLVNSNKDDPAEAESVRRDWAQHLRELGPDRWPFLLVKVFAKDEGYDDVAFDQGALIVTAGKNANNIGFLDPTILARQLGKPFASVKLLDRQSADPPLPASSAKRKIVLAIDWSEYVATPERSKWLIRELRNATENRSTLIEVRLQLPDRALAWPIMQLHAGSLPVDLPPGHHLHTLDSLKEFLRSIPLDYGDSQIAFLTWNPASSSQAMDKDSADFLRSQAARCRLQILQFHGERLPALVQMVNSEFYSVFEYRPDGPPVLLWPWDRR